jgi:predicted O-methyltransferase YrrM
MNGQPAFPRPDERDRAWTPGGYDPLAPSRPDGQPTFSNTWFQGNQKHWARVLAELKGKPDLSYLEVGVYEGQALIWVFRNLLTHETSTGVGIDIFEHQGLKDRFIENLERAGLEDRVTVLVGFSNEQLRSLEPRSFDLIYIDASHIAIDVMRDAVLCWDLLRDGGFLVFDDYAYTPHFPMELKPKFAIDAFITAFRDELIVAHREWQVIVKKKKDACPGMCSSLGPYQYHWNWWDPPEEEGQGRSNLGVLYDPRTNARVPLNDEELMLVEELLRSRPIGVDGILLRADSPSSDEVMRLRRKLDI